MPPPLETPANCPPGLEYLAEIDQVLVEQQVEECKFRLATKLNLSLAAVATDAETKYQIKNILGQQVYLATEGEGCCR